MEQSRSVEGEESHCFNRHTGFLLDAVFAGLHLLLFLVLSGYFIQPLYLPSFFVLGWVFPQSMRLWACREGRKITTQTYAARLNSNIRHVRIRVE